MTKMLEKAFAEVAKLPEIEQNKVAKWLLDELASEKDWETLFSDSEEALNQLADEALEEHRHAKTRPLDLNIL